MKFRALLLIALTSLTLCNSGLGSDTAIQLQSSVSRMKNWLGTGAAAEGWRRALLLNVLESQAARGDQAHVATMQEVLARFQASTPGLEHPAFVDVRRALEGHVKHLSNIQFTDLAAAVAAAESRFQPIPATDVTSHRVEAVYQLQLLDNYYHKNLSEPKLTEALTALKLDEVINDLQSIDPLPIIDSGNAEASADVAKEQARNKARTDAIATLRGHVQNFDDQARVYFDPFFGSAQHSLDRYFRIVFYASDKDLKQGFSRQLKVISDNLALLGDPLQRRASGLVGNALGWLENAQQVPDLVTAIRTAYSQPNLQGQISGQFINRLTSRNSPETRPVNEVILGRLIQGTSYINTNVSIELQDDPNQVSASIRASGNIRSDNFTKQGPITAFSGSNGEFEVRRHVLANIGGFYANSPYAAANLQSEFRGTSSRLRIINKFATKAYCKDKVLSEGIAAGRAETKIQDQFQRQSDETLAAPRAQVDKAYQKTREYTRLMPDLFVNSRKDAVVVTARRSDAFRLGAPKSSPPASVQADVQIQIHESMLSNYVDPYFASRTLTNEDMAKQAGELLGSTPDAFQQKSDEEKWSITFAGVQAVQVQVDDNRLVVSINGRRFSQADQAIRAALIIRITYKVVRVGDQLMLVNDGKATVNYENPADESARILAFKTFLEDKLNSVDNKDNGLELPANLIPIEKVEALQSSEIAKSMRLVEFTADDGWISLGWNYQPVGGAYAATAIHTPAIEQADGTETPKPATDSPSAPPQPDGQ